MKSAQKGVHKKKLPQRREGSPTITWNDGSFVSLMRFRPSVSLRRWESESCCRHLRERCKNQQGRGRRQASLQTTRALSAKWRQRVGAPCEKLLSSSPRVCLHNPHPRLVVGVARAIWKVPLGCWSRDNWSQVYSEFLVFAFGAKFSSSQPRPLLRLCRPTGSRDIITQVDTFFCTGAWAVLFESPVSVSSPPFWKFRCFKSQILARKIACVAAACFTLVGPSTCLKEDKNNETVAQRVAVCSAQGI